MLKVMGTVQPRLKTKTKMLRFQQAQSGRVSTLRARDVVAELFRLMRFDEDRSGPTVGPGLTIDKMRCYG